MFEQSFIAQGSGRGRGWSLAGSLVVQSFAVAFLALLPLLFTYKLDTSAWARGALFFTPPPPPAPKPPPARRPPKGPPPPRRFDSKIYQPTAIPESSALAAGPDSEGIAPALVPAGGGSTVNGFDDGVLGGVLLPDVKPAQPWRIRVGGRVQSARAVHKVAPVYPMQAREEGISGVVRLEAVIAADGSIKRLRTLEGDPLLAAAAREAISQWRYRPTLLNGKAVEVLTSIDVNFKLEPVEVDEKGRPIEKKEKGKG